MTPHGERLVRRALLGGAGSCLAGALYFGSLPFLRPLEPRRLPDPERVATSGAPAYAPQDLELFARKKISRAIVKAAPPPPAKPVVAPLDLVVRLSGIMDYGPQNPREAFIEIRSTNQTKAYRVGDALPNLGAVVKAISDGVVMEYDGKLWKLTDRGVQPAADPAPSSGAKP